MASVQGPLLQDADGRDVGQGLRQLTVRKGDRMWHGHEQVEATDRLAAQSERHGADRAEAGPERCWDEQRPALPSLLEVLADDRHAGADAVQARSLVVLQDE